ncbi:MAG: hypothetical protein SNJ72_10935 [Fimbriimonadales bacterium]
MMSNELWQRAEDIAHDLRMLYTLLTVVRCYMGRTPAYPVSGDLLDIITTLDAIAEFARTLSSEQRNRFQAFAFDIEIPFALAREARREFTPQERHQVSEVMQTLRAELEKLVSQLEREEALVWEQIAKNTGL